MTQTSPDTAPEPERGEAFRDLGVDRRLATLEIQGLRADVENQRLGTAITIGILGVVLMMEPAGEETEDEFGNLQPEKPIPEAERPQPAPPPLEAPKDEAGLRALIQKEEGDQFDKTWPLFEALGKEKGWKAAFYSYAIHRNLQVNIGDGLQTGKRYQSTVDIRNFEGRERKGIRFSCVGSTLSALACLPFKAVTGDSAERYLSDYNWGGKDAFVHFIPDMAGRDPSRYTVTNNFNPDDINASVPLEKLGVGEYAIAAFYNHVFLIYRDLDGVVRMRHSGANIDENGKYRGGPSRLNETTLAGYGRYHQRRYGKEVAGKLIARGKPENEAQAAGAAITRKFIFMPVTQMIEAGEAAGNVQIGQYFEGNLPTT